MKASQCVPFAALGSERRGSSLLALMAAAGTSSAGFTWRELSDWRPIVRAGPNYKWNKRKEASAAPFYRPVFGETLRSESNLFHAADSARAAKRGLTTLPTATPELSGLPLPELLVFNIQIPLVAARLIGRPALVPSSNTIVHFRISEEAAAMARSDLRAAPPALQLLIKWCRGAASDDALRSRLKLVCYVDNLDVVAPSMPAMVKRHNGKPVLITKSGSLFSGSLATAKVAATAGSECGGDVAVSSTSAATGKYIEVDIDTHHWNIVALQVLESWRECSAACVLRAALVIEARADDEMPECVLGTVELTGLDLTRWTPK